MPLVESSPVSRAHASDDSEQDIDTIVELDPLTAAVLETFPINGSLTTGLLSTDLYSSGQNISIKADTINLAGRTIDSGAATSAGSITLEGRSITIDGGAMLLAKAHGAGSDGGFPGTSRRGRWGSA